MYLGPLLIWDTPLLHVHVSWAFIDMGYTPITCTCILGLYRGLISKWAFSCVKYVSTSCIVVVVPRVLYLEPIITTCMLGLPKVSFIWRGSNVY